MQSEAKAAILGEILKREGTFKPQDISLATGATRQLVNYHLSQLLEKGLIEKGGSVYIVVDRSELIDSLASASEKVTSKRGWPNVCLDYENIKNAVRMVHLARAFDFEGSLELKRATNDLLNDAIKSLKREKSFLATGSVSKRAAAKDLAKDNENGYAWAKTYYKTLGNADIKVSVRESEMQATVQDEVSEVLDS